MSQTDRLSIFSSGEGNQVCSEALIGVPSHAGAEPWIADRVGAADVFASNCRRGALRGLELRAAPTRVPVGAPIVAEHRRTLRH
ncbi:MAG: hypothetical protein H7Y19_12045 [Luteimonas sp.]|nr:hypothetical protein [Luteimonas sp.]